MDDRHIYTVINNAPEPVVVTYVVRGTPQIWSTVVDPGEGGSTLIGQAARSWINATVEVRNEDCQLRSEITIGSAVQTHEIRPDLSIAAVSLEALTPDQKPNMLPEEPGACDQGRPSGSP